MFKSRNYNNVSKKRIAKFALIEYCINFRKYGIRHVCMDDALDVCMNDVVCQSCPTGKIKSLEIFHLAGIQTGVQTEARTRDLWVSSRARAI